MCPVWENVIGAWIAGFSHLSTCLSDGDNFPLRLFLNMGPQVFQNNWNKPKYSPVHKSMGQRKCIVWWHSHCISKRVPPTSFINCLASTSQVTYFCTKIYWSTYPLLDMLIKVKTVTILVNFIPVPKYPYKCNAREGQWQLQGTVAGNIWKYPMEYAKWHSSRWNGATTADVIMSACKPQLQKNSTFSHLNWSST